MNSSQPHLITAGVFIEDLFMNPRLMTVKLVPTLNCLITDTKKEELRVARNCYIRSKGLIEMNILKYTTIKFMENRIVFSSKENSLGNR